MKYLFIVSSILYLLLGSYSFSQNLLTKASSTAIDEALDIETDNSGNSYITGFVGGQTNFGTITTSSLGGQDIFVAKMDNAGNFIWIKTFGGSGAERGLDLALDNNGNVYLTGYFFGSATFGTINLTSNAGSRDLFVAKINGNNGNVIWANSAGGTDAETGHSVTCDNAGNVIVAGQFEGTITLGTDTYTTPLNTATNAPASGILVIKYNSSGTLVWSQVGISDFNNKAVAIDNDASNNLYITGNFSDDLLIDGVTITNQQLNVGYTAKLNANGDLSWFRKIVANTISPVDLKVNGSDLLVTGDFQGDLIYYGANSNETLVPIYTNNFFLIKTNTSSNFSWAKKVGSDNFLSVKALAINGSGEGFVTGSFECNLEEIRPTLGTALWTGIGAKDIFVMKYSSTGARLWERHQGGMHNDVSYGISLNGSNNPLVCGSFKSNFYMAMSGPAAFPSYISSADQLTLTGCGVNTGLSTSGNNDIDILIFEPFENSSQPPFNYYFDNTGVCQDSVLTSYIPDVDTVNVCNGTTLNFSPVHMVGGPSTNQIVNGNPSLASNYSFSVSSTGDYIIEITRMDGCGTTSDTIHVNILPSPPGLWLTDDAGVNNQDIPYLPINLCDPDTLSFYLDSVPANMDVSISFGGNVISDTNWVNGLTEAGSYNVTLENEYGCTSSNSVQFNLDSTAYDSIIPYLSFLNNEDSTSICAGESVSVYALDSITNPAGNLIIWDGDYMEVSWNNGPFVKTSNPADLFKFFWPSSTGWFNLNFQIVIGYDNSCGTFLDTLSVVDSFYVEVLELPGSDLDIAYSANICPGGTGTVAVDTSILSFTWSGPGITNISADNTTITVDQPGGYVFQGILTNPITGCSANVFIPEFISIKNIPQITSSINPTFICPGDSVELSVGTAGLTYDWIGPNGNSVGNTSSIFASDHGDYYCIVLDADSCLLVSDHITVTEYTSPNININGTPTLCGEDSLYLDVSYFGQPNFLWQPSGDTTSGIMVYDPGYYYCTIELCGITTTDSILVQDMSIAPTLNIGDTLFCVGDSIFVEATNGFDTYIWSPSGIDSSGIWVSSPGEYFATATSSYGCTANTDTVNIGYFLGNENMNFPDLTLCIGDSTAFEYTGNGSIEWFINNNFMGNQDTYSIPQLSSPFTMVYTIDRPYCGPYTDSFEVNLSPIPEDLTFLMDGEYCHNDSIILSVQDLADSYVWTDSNNDQYTGNNFVIYPIDQSNSGMYYVSISDAFCTTEDSISLNVFAPNTVVLNTDTSLICKISSYQVYDTINTFNALFWEFENTYFQDDETLFVDQYFEDGYYVLQGTDTNNCPMLSDSVQVYNTNNHNFFIQMDTSACVNTNLTLYTDEIPNTNFNWVLPDGSDYFDNPLQLFNLSTSDMGWYDVEIEIFDNCIYTDSLYLDVYTPQEFYLGNDTLICRKEFLGIYPPDGLNNFYWEDGSNNVPHSVYGNINTVILTNIDENGCYFSDTLLLELSNCEPIIPNVITVNNDGMNDYFVIKNSEKHPRNRLEILNRWGNLIYEKDYYDNTFNGEGLSDGTYFYIYYEDTDIKDEKPLTGFLTIIND